MIGQGEPLKTFPWEQWQNRSVQQKYPSLAQVLSSWEIVPAYASIEGTVCRVKSQSGRWWVLKRIEQREQAEFIGALLDRLSQYQLTPAVEKTKYGDNIAYWFDGYYYLMPMIQGKECSNYKLADVSLAAQRLALLHQYGRNLSLPHFSGGNLQEINSRLQQCKEVCAIDVEKIENEQVRLAAADYLYGLNTRLANFPRYQCQEMAKQAALCQTICHHHFHCGQLLREHRSAYIVHWDEAAVGIQLLDLADFCYKILSKNKWQPEYFLAICNGYQDILPLSGGERSLLEEILLLPVELERALRAAKGSKRRGKRLEKAILAAIETDKQKLYCLEVAKGNIVPSHREEKEKDKKERERRRSAREKARREKEKERKEKERKEKERRERQRKEKADREKVAQVSPTTAAQTETKRTDTGKVEEGETTASATAKVTSSVPDKEDASMDKKTGEEKETPANAGEKQEIGE